MMITRKNIPEILHRAGGLSEEAYESLLKYIYGIDPPPKGFIIHYVWLPVCLN
jgi:hypothetical protein